MKKIFPVLSILLLTSTYSFAQYDYEPSKENPFGTLNPAAFPQTADFAPLIGESECKSQNRAPDGTWNNEVDMIWRWKYIMNGMAVQDETLKADGAHSGSIRQFNADSTKWYVHYYSSSGATNRLPAWEGSKTEDGDIILYREQAAPNGTEGFYRLTFYNITDESFDWVGEWVNTNETFSYATWKISCIKKTSSKHNAMTNIIPYIAFPGNCRQAMTFYAEVFEGDISHIVTFKESQIEVPKENDDRIFDSEMIAKDIKIKASDNLEGQSVDMGNGISLFISIKDSNRRKQIFDQLAEGGNIMFPLDDNFGMLKDKFDIQWMIVPGN